MTIHKKGNATLFRIVLYLLDKNNIIHDPAECYYDVIGSHIYEAIVTKKAFTITRDTITFDLPQNPTDAIENVPILLQNKAKWLKYRDLCRQLTKLSNIESLPNSNKQRVKHFKDFSNRELYSIDHKISIYYGFVNNINPEHIAHADNLRIIKLKDNILKGKAVFVDQYNAWIADKYNIK